MIQDEQKIYTKTIETVVIIAIISMLAMAIVCSVSLVAMSAQSQHAINTSIEAVTGTDRPDDFELGD